MRDCSRILERNGRALIDATTISGAFDPQPAAAARSFTMSKAGALDLASGLGGKINKAEVKSAVDEYVSESRQVFVGGTVVVLGMLWGSQRCLRIN